MDFGFEVVKGKFPRALSDVSKLLLLGHQQSKRQSYSIYNDKGKRKAATPPIKPAGTSKC